MKSSIEIEDKEGSMVATQENSNAKKEKEKEKKKKSIMKEDRLSNLPDEVIHRILSFVDAKTAVQTSVLSKRWRYLWTSLQILNFHDQSFYGPHFFQGFVEDVLSRRDASINIYMLKLVCDNKVDYGYIIDSIIDYVIPRGIQVLSIFAPRFIKKLPQLYACQSLTTLKLADIAFETRTFDFVFLKNLYLFDCLFEYGVEEVIDPFRGCANLRCLFLHGCQFDGIIKRFKISAPLLSDLLISYMRVDQLFGPDCVIELFTPKLQSFSYHDSFLYDFSTKVNLPFVEKVMIHVGGFDLSDELNKATNLSLQLIELFEVMGSAKFVSLSPDIIKVLSMCPALLVGRSSPFTKVQNFQLKKYRPSIPTNVMAFLFGGSS